MSQVSTWAAPPPSQTKMQCSALPRGYSISSFLCAPSNGEPPMVTSVDKPTAAFELRLTNSRRENVFLILLWDEYKFRCVHQCPDHIFHPLAPLRLEPFRWRVTLPDLILQLLLDPCRFWIQVV